MLATLYAAGIDYLTMTTNDGKTAAKTLQEYNIWAEHMKALGHEEKPEHILGYKGVKCANVFFGERHDGWMTRASDWQAGVWYRAMPFPMWKPTRIDIQLTGVFGEDVENFAVEQASNAVAQREHSTGGRPYRVQLIRGFGAGDTLTVGSRSSQRYGRLYDKHRESKGEYPEGAWRWELETKEEAAEEVNKMLRTADDETPLIAGLIIEYYTARGVQVPINVASSPAILHLGRNTADDERSLRWLSHYVRPTVDRLKRKGHEARVREALGLTCQ